MKASIDNELCTGCGLCVDSCPSVFEMSDDKAVVKADTVPDDSAECAREAASNCPVEAIKVT
jgi:ferredoxin